ncbi:MAG: YraN family protein [Myxococcota bacterium]
MTDPRIAVARRGEALVASLLERRGATILGRNVRVGRDEMDLVARAGPLLLFVEVRTRRSDRFGPPAASIDAKKRARFRRAAGRLLASGRFGPGPVRLDAAGVILAPGRAPVVNYYPAAL